MQDTSPYILIIFELLRLAYYLQMPFQIVALFIFSAREPSFKMSHPFLEIFVIFIILLSQSHL